MRTAWRRALLTLATVLLAVGMLAGVANREVLDGAHFARHADQVRQDANVAQLVGVAISNRVLDFNEDLVALRPAIEAVAVQLVRSPAFSGIVRAAVEQVHEAFTKPGSGQVLLRLSDLTAVLVAALRTVAPNVAASLPADLDVRLADIGAQSFAARTVHLTRLVGLLSWLLPLLGLLCLAAAVIVSRRRQRTLAMTGLSVAGAGLLVAIATAITATWASSTDTETLSGALRSASWDELAPIFWRTAAVIVVAGCVIFAAAAAYLPQWSVAAVGRRAFDWFRSPGPRPLPQLLAGAVMVIVGAAALFRPLSTARVVVEAAGLVVLIEGIARVSRVSAQGRAADEATVGPKVRRGSRRRWIGRSIAVVGALGLVAYLVIAALPADRKISFASGATDPKGCNGFVELCSRPYNDVAYVSTHNSMSAADANWFIPEQPTGVIGQLNAGVRALLIDSWYGQATNRSGVIATSEAARPEALAQAQAEYGAAVVDSALRLRSALSLTPKGPVQPYLCHGLCELGATLWLPVMQQVHTWLADHPRQVITFIIEDTVTPADTAKIFQEAGLLPYLHTQVPGQPWPTLGQMIDSNQRVVVFMQRHGGGTTYPWMLQAFDSIQDTPYDTSSQNALSCDRLRGEADNPLLLINNFLNRFQSRVSDSAKVNAYSALWPYVNRCQTERGQLPNYIAVDFYDRGDVFRVVNQLNGVG